MNIAIISDIHGNLDALETVLEDIHSQGCTKIFALGDYAMAGPEPSQTVDWFMSKLNDDNFTMIQGNTDHMIANFSESVFDNIKNAAPVMAEALRNDVLILTDSQKTFLRNLPEKVEIIEDGIKILLVHGSPRKNNENILPDTSLNELEEMIKNTNANIILCGHTHMPCGFQTNSKRTVINVGSVGRPFTPKPEACYLKLIISNGECLFEHRFVKYDNQKASKKLLERGFSGTEKLAQTLIDPRERHF